MFASFLTELKDKHIGMHCGDLLLLLVFLVVEKYYRSSAPIEKDLERSNACMYMKARDEMFVMSMSLNIKLNPQFTRIKRVIYSHGTVSQNISSQSRIKILLHMIQYPRLLGIVLTTIKIRPFSKKCWFAVTRMTNSEIPQQKRCSAILTFFSFFGPAFRCQYKHKMLTDKFYLFIQLKVWQRSRKPA